MSDLTKKDIVYVNPDDDFKTVLSCFKSNRISHVPVMNENKLVGIISKTDAVEYLHNKHEDYGTQSLDATLTAIKAKEVMVQPLIEAKENDPAVYIIEKLLEHEVGSVVIRADNGSISGIVTERDMLKYLHSRLPEEMSFTESVGMHVVQWLDSNGLLKVSKALADIGI